MIYCQIDLSVASNHIQDHDEVFAHVAENIIKKANWNPRLGVSQLVSPFEIEDFDSSYDEMVCDFLYTCIPAFSLGANIQHMDGRSKIILS